MVNYKAIGGSSIGLAIIILIIALNYEVTPNTYYCSNEPEKLMECYSLSGGLGSRCYLNELKTKWDYCTGGWVKALDYIEEVQNIQTCETRFWDTSKDIYIDCVQNYTTIEAYDCLDEKDNSTCQYKMVVKYYNSTCLDRIEITSHNETICIDTGKESFDGNSNAWANPDPGPRCSYCEEYECNCSS